MIRLPKKRRRTYRPNDSKRCPRCGEVWPLELEFYRILCVKGIPYSWHSYCRACEVEWRREKGYSHKKGEGVKCRGLDATTGAAVTDASAAASAAESGAGS